MPLLVGKDVQHSHKMTKVRSCGFASSLILPVTEVERISRAQPHYIFTIVQDRAKAHSEQ